MLVNKNYFLTYCMLVRRDAVVIQQRLTHALINATVRVLVSVIEFGGLFPAMGVPHDLVAPLFIGAIAMQLLFQGMGFGIRTLFDLKFNRFIDYHMTLPLPKRWLFASYITYFCMEAAIVTLPLFSIGIILLSDAFQSISPNYPLFIVIYMMTLIFNGLLFLGLSFYYQFDWFMQNLWPRRLTFLLMLSPLFFVWHKAREFSPKASLIMLASPLTYSAEGLRATLIGGTNYIPVHFCILGLGVSILFAIGFAARGITNRLDPV